MIHRFIIGMVASGLAGAALADPTLECAEFSSQVEIGGCVSEMEGRVEVALDFIYGQARAVSEDLDGSTGREMSLPALEAAQEAWLAYRDTQCEFVGTTFGGGSGTGIGISACRVELGRARVEELLDAIR